MRIELLEVSDVARALGVSKDLVRQLVERGRITPFATTPRGLRLFAQHDVMALRRERDQRRARVAMSSER
jgi:excisionase family DNA binding protein